MNIIKTLAGISLVLALNGTAWAEYDYCTNENEAHMPDVTKVEIPDGSKAAIEDMVTAQGAVKEFNKKVEEHIACLDEEAKAAGDEMTEEQNAEMVARHNGAVEAMEKLAEAFNVEVRNFKTAEAERKAEEDEAGDK